MSGRPLHSLLELLQTKFEENVDKIIDNRNKVTVPSADIWIEIAEQIEHKKTPKAIYTDALRWWQVKSEKPKENPDGDFSDEPVDASSPGDSSESYVSSADEAPQINDINFTISNNANSE